MPIDSIYGGYQPTTPYGHDASSRKNLAGADPYRVPDMNTPKPKWGKYAKYSAEPSSSGSKKPDQPLLLAGLPSKPLSADEVDQVLGGQGSSHFVQAGSSTQSSSGIAFNPMEVAALAFKKAHEELANGTQIKGIDAAVSRSLEPSNPSMVQHGLNHGFPVKNRSHASTLSDYVNSQGEYHKKGIQSLNSNYGKPEWSKLFSKT